MIEENSIRKQYESMSDEQLWQFAKDEGISLTPEALLILRNEFRSRNMEQTILDDIGNGTLLQKYKQVNEVENIVLPQFNSTLLSNALNEIRDGKTNMEMRAWLMESGLDEEQAGLLLSQIEPSAIKLLDKATTSLLTGIFVCLAGMAIHLINLRPYNISPAGILATCALLIGLFKIIKGIIDRKKFLLILKRSKENNMPD